MNSSQMFVLDSNIFVQAARQYYAFDLVPIFWRVLKEYAQKGNICTIDFVKSEVEAGKDKLAKWFKKEFLNWCFNTMNDVEVTKVYKNIINWVYNNPQFKEEAKKDFASGADGWIIAYAKAYKYIVVTHERFDPNVKNKVPIPNVCKQFGVGYIDTFDMMRSLGMKLDYNKRLLLHKKQ